MENEIFDTASVIYVENQNIDRSKWDKCIGDACNGLIYGLSFYLDTMAKHWDGLVMNDYEAVMPVTWNKKYGIYYLYQPFLCGCLGVFGNRITGEMITCFLDKVPKRFKYWDIYLNPGNNFPIAKYNTYKRTTYVLELNKAFPALWQDYRNSYKQLIKKSTAGNLRVVQNIDVGEILRLAKIKLKPVSKLKHIDWQNFLKLYNMLLARSMAINYGVYAEGELLASGIFLFSANRAYYVLAGNKSKSQSPGASHLVINTFIQHHAARDIVLDFEGSSIPGIAFFFKGFGAKAQEYPGVKYNALPAVLRWLKR